MERSALEKLLVKDLKKLLKEKGLSTAGRKLELVNRLDQYWSRQDKTSSPLSSIDGSILTGNPDTDRLILLRLNDKKLRAICLVNKYMANIVCNWEFWMMRVETTHGKEVKDIKPGEMSYKNQYFSLIRYARKQCIKKSIEDNRLDAFISFINKKGINNIIDIHLGRLGTLDRLKMLRYIHNNHPDKLNKELVDLIWWRAFIKANINTLDWIYYTFNVIYDYDWSHSHRLSSTQIIELLRWYIGKKPLDDEDIVNMGHRYLYRLPVLKELKDLCLFNFKAVDLLEDVIWPRIEPETLQWFINNGVLIDTPVANIYAYTGRIKQLNILKTHGIIPDEQGVTRALIYGQISFIKWFVKESTKSKDKLLLERWKFEILEKRNTLRLPGQEIDFSDILKEIGWNSS